MRSKRNKPAVKRNKPVAKKGKNREKEREARLKEKITEALELPKEIVLNVPRLTMIGNTNLVIENYKGIVEYASERIRVNTGTGTIRITGNGLVLKEITSEDILVDGDILGLEFLK